MKRWILSSAAVIGATLVPSLAAAQTMGAIATSITAQVTSIGTLISVISFVLGVAVAIFGLMKFKAHGDNPNDPSNKLSTAWILVLVGAGLVAVPAVLNSGVATIFGASATTTNGNTGFGNRL